MAEQLSLLFSTDQQAVLCEVDLKGRTMSSSFISDT